MTTNESTLQTATPSLVPSLSASAEAKPGLGMVERSTLSTHPSSRIPSGHPTPSQPPGLPTCPSTGPSDPLKFSPLPDEPPTTIRNDSGFSKHFLQALFLCMQHPNIRQL